MFFFFFFNMVTMFFTCRQHRGGLLYVSCSCRSVSRKHAEVRVGPVPGSDPFKQPILVKVKEIVLAVFNVGRFFNVMSLR